MQPQYNLAKFVNWTELGRELGFLGNTVRALPANVTCPICRRRTNAGNFPSRSSIFHHFTLGGQWHRCTGCGHRGDLISLASQTWGLDTTATIARCRRLRLIPEDNVTRETVENYLQGLKFDQAVQTVWQEATTGGLYRPPGQRLARISGWRASASVDWRDQGLDQVLGCMPAQRIEELLGNGRGHKFGRSCFRSGVSVDPTVGRVFPGSDWHSVLVVPYYDLPDRVVGFHLRGRTLQLEKDKVFCCADPDRDPGVREGGLHLHPKLFDYSGDMIGFSSLRWCLRMQSRHLDTCPDPLPVFSWLSEPGVATTTGWQSLAAQRLILWEPQLTASALAVAIRQDAAIAVCPISNKSEPAIAIWLGELQPLDFVGLVSEQARSWPEILSELRRNSPDKFINIVETLAAEEDLLERLRHDCDERTVKAVKQISRQIRPYRTVQYGHKLIERRKDGLYLLSRPRTNGVPERLRICNGNLRLEKLVWYPENKDADYIGQLTSDGRALEFSVDRDTLLNYPRTWLEAVSLSAGLPPVQCLPGWEYKLHDISLLFHKPKPEVGFERAGWSAEHSAFILPRWKIDYGGRYYEHRLFRRTPATPGDIAPEKCRGSLLPKLLANTPVNRAFWQLYIEFLGLVMLPALDTEPANLLLTGPVNDLASAVASAFQSPPLTAANRAAELAGLHHRWPMWLPGPLGLQGWPTDNLGSLVSTVSWPEALSLFVGNSQQLQPGAQQRVLTRVNPIGAPTVADCSGLGWLLFEYLQQVCATQFAGLTRDTYAQHFWNFVGEVHGAQLEFAPSGWREYGAVDGASELLARLVGWMLSEGYTSILPKRVHDESNVLWFEDDLLFIPKMLVRQCLREEGCNDASMECLSERLLAEARIKGEELVNGRVCWCVSGTWLFKYAKASRNKELGNAAIRLAE